MVCVCDSIPQTQNTRLLRKIYCYKKRLLQYHNNAILKYACIPKWSAAYKSMVGGRS